MTTTEEVEEERDEIIDNLIKMHEYIWEIEDLLTMGLCETALMKSSKEGFREQIKIRWIESA